MTVEEKANSLIYQFSVVSGKELTLVQAKWCAIFHINEILSLDVWDWPHNAEQSKLYYQDVKEHLLNQ